MEKVIFADSWRPFFRGLGMQSFDDIYHYAGGTKLGENKRRNIYRITLGPVGDSRTLYIKRFHNTHLKDLLTAWFNFGRPTSQAHTEWANAKLLLENGIDTYKPVCMGERTVCGFESKSFIITDELTSTCLLDFVQERWTTLDRPTQERIITAMARLVRKAHDVNICLQDLYIWHLFIEPETIATSPRLAVIDLHRMLRNITDPERKLADLGKLYWSLSDEYFDPGHKELLVRAYASDRPEVFEKVRRRAARTGKRRILRNHYSRPKL